MNQTRKPSVLGRAILAVLLTIGFYGLALLVVLLLLGSIYLQMVAGHLYLRLVLGALIGAFVILYAIFPRPDNFQPPGPRMTHKHFPKLFDEIENIARKTEQTIPRDVYLVPNVNAFVAQRGGFMGIGSRRVMGIGLPLFQILTIDELRSVLAHEFGHFYGGDTSLGPWVYKTREAIIRTVANVGRQSQLLQAPFMAYGKMFLRVTNAVSRQQEYTADQLSAKLIGKEIAIEGLKKIHKYAPAYDSYFQQEYLPIVNAGYQPPLMDGFEIFLKSEIVTKAISEYYEKQLHEGKADPYDSHPSLKERIEALENYSGPAKLADNTSATSLLMEPGQMEGPLLRALAVDREKIKGLKSLRWDEVANVIIPRWGETAIRYEQEFAGVNIEDLAEIDAESMFTKIATRSGMLPAGVKSEQITALGRDVHVRLCNDVIGQCLGYLLTKEGWELHFKLGEPALLTKDEHTIDPFNVYAGLMKGTIKAEKWRETCIESGIDNLVLANFKEVV